MALGPVSAGVQRSLFISRKALLPRMGKGLCVTERHKGSSPRLRAPPECARRQMPPLCSKSNASIKKKNKPRRENSCQRHYRHANKNNGTKTLIFRVSAAESPATQRSRSQPAPSAATPQPPGKQRIQADRSRRSGTGSQSRRRMGSTGSHARSGILNPNFLTSLPYSPVPPRRCQRRHPPAPADRAAGSGQKQKPSPLAAA